MKIAILFRRYGPYHCARLRGASSIGDKVGWEARGFSVCAFDSSYEWQPVVANSASLVTLFPRTAYEEIQRASVVAAVTSALNDWQPDAVAIPGYYESCARIALGWCRKHRRVAVLMSESKNDDNERYYFVELFKRWLVHLFDAALVGGQAQAAYAARLGLDPDTIFLGYDAVDNGYFSREAEKARAQETTWRQAVGIARPFVAASCRFIARKNIPVLVEAYAQYRATVGPERAWDLALLGSGEDESRIRHTASRLGVSAAVHMPGFRQIDELPAWYGIASLFIHPALQEQWGLVVNEAMASGTPVAVSRTAGAAELVRDGIDGWLFDPRDPRELANILVTAHQAGPERLREMGAAAVERMRDWGPERFGAALFDAVRAGQHKSSRRPQSDVLRGTAVIASTRWIG